MMRATSRRVAPSARRERTRRSTVTVGSPASILATRDWLDRTAFANSCWVSRLLSRRLRSPSASRSLSSTYASSSGDSPRNSVALPIFQPFAAKRFRFNSRIVVLPKTFLAHADNLQWRCCGLLAEHLDDHDRVRIDSVDQPPSLPFVVDSKLMTPRSYRRHGPRVGHRDSVSSLKAPKEVPGLKSRRRR